MGENTITNIMKVSVVGTSFKESEKKSLRIRIIVQENNSQQAEESKEFVCSECIAQATEV